jgi:hypothetical protein
VKKGQVLTILITGSEGDDYGPFKLTVDLAKTGSSLATATFIGSNAKMEVSGSTQGYSQTYVSTCNSKLAFDGRDVVRAVEPAANVTSANPGACAAVPPHARPRGNQHRHLMCLLCSSTPTHLPLLAS